MRADRYIVAYPLFLSQHLHHLNLLNANVTRTCEEWRNIIIGYGQMKWLSNLS